MKDMHPKKHPPTFAGKSHKPAKGKEGSKDSSDDAESFPGYPEYPPEEDILNRGNERNKVDIDVENVTRSARINNELPLETADDLSYDEKGEIFEHGESGRDLDIPGAELDDPAEDIGSEDEENNFYSLGGDRHNDLEEDPAGDNEF
jgi:thioredoxin reductase